MIGKAIAGEAKATFFYISASSLTSKWVSFKYKMVLSVLRGEKMVIRISFISSLLFIIFF